MDDAVHREFRVLCRYLVRREMGAAASARYQAWHDAHGARETASALAIDRALVALARLHPFATHVADAYAARMRPASLLRRKLVLVLALAECSPETYASLEGPRSVGRSAAYARLVAGAAGEALLFVAGAIVLLPLHGILALAPARRGSAGSPP